MVNYSFFSLIYLYTKFMVVPSKFIDTGKRYYLNKKHCAWYINILNRDISGSLKSDIFYSPSPPLDLRKCFSSSCKACP